QTACALAWSGKDPSTLGDLATYTDRHRTACEAVSEAARRAQQLMDTLAVDDDSRAPREKAAAQRLWLKVLDRHEAWVRRRDSRKGLLMAEPEISAGSVTIFKDSQLLPKGTFGTTYAAEYLAMPVSATVLPITTSDPMAVVWSTASARLLRRSATSELRSLASLVPPHPRLARTHGNESVSAQAPLRVVNSGDDGGGGMQEGAGKEEPVALVLVGEMVEGGSLRGRMRTAGAAASAREETSAEAVPSVAAPAPDASSGEGVPPPEAPVPRLVRRRRVLADVAQGLAYLHERGVSHGALTSENVLLDAEGRAKLSLFGLAETRKAVEALKLASVTASEEWDTLPARKAAPRVVAAGGGAWTAPEAWPAAKEAEASAGSATVLAVAEALERKKQAAFAADAYAFGMVAWEVLTGVQPWEGLLPEEVSRRVRQGERPPLSFEAISLEDFDNFGDLVRLLWAQDPNARPALQDVARLLGVPEPPRAPRTPPPSAAAAAAIAGGQEIAEEGVEVIDGDEFWDAADVDDSAAAAAAAASEGTEERVASAVDGPGATGPSALATETPFSEGAEGHEQAKVEEGREGGETEPPPTVVAPAASAGDDNGGALGGSPAGIVVSTGASGRQMTLGGEKSDFAGTAEEKAVREERGAALTIDASAEERGDTARQVKNALLVPGGAVVTTAASATAEAGSRPVEASGIVACLLDAEIGSAQTDEQPPAAVVSARAEEAGPDDAVSDLAPPSSADAADAPDRYEEEVCARPLIVPGCDTEMTAPGVVSQATAAAIAGGGGGGAAAAAVTAAGDAGASGGGADEAASAGAALCGAPLEGGATEVAIPGATRPSLSTKSPSRGVVPRPPGVTPPRATAGVTTTPGRSRQMLDVIPAPSVQPLVSSSPLGSTDSSPLHRVEELLLLGSERGETRVNRVVGGGGTAGGAGAGAREGAAAAAA
ncbi:unnamed protein product, partial [Scytosiphon promiscuus]